MQGTAIIPHLFRTEYRKIVAVLCRRFGFGDIETAEDIAGETFLTAAQVWGLKGAPENPEAWLYAVAKNKAKNFLQRQLTLEETILPELQRNAASVSAEEIDLSETNIDDSQLRMIFAVCNPSIPVEAQVALALRILCGFGIDEIADAFLTNRETITKRLQRARNKLRGAGFTAELPESGEIAQRLNSVLKTIYLLFNEGYFSASANTALRRDLCLEAMRLARMLLDTDLTNTRAANALMALMCFHASRFDARIGNEGELILYGQQNRELWNPELQQAGVSFLKKSSGGDELSRYHLEAGIAFWHTIKEDSPEKWPNILKLFDALIAIDNSPSVALNRSYAIAQVNGNAAALLEVAKLKIPQNHLYHLLMAELYSDNPIVSAKFLKKSLQSARSEAEQNVIRTKLAAING